MPYSGSRKNESPGAIAPIAWYLLNLLALPIIGFGVLLWMFLKSGEASALRRAHSKAAGCMSVLGADLIGSGGGFLWVLCGIMGIYRYFVNICVLVCPM